MKKIFKIILIIFIVLYVVSVLAISIFILKENTYGVSEYKDNVYVLIDSKNETSKYEKGSLVVVKKKSIKSLKENEEVFVYKRDEDRSIYVKSGVIKTIVDDGTNPHIMLEDDDNTFREDLIIGKSVNVIKRLGGIIIFLESKWVFFFLIILPCSLLAVYEVYYIFKNLVFSTKIPE